MARHFDSHHRHWWILPAPGDTALTCTACRLIVPFSEINLDDLFAHPELTRTRQSRRVVREALTVALAHRTRTEQEPERS